MMILCKSYLAAVKYILVASKTVVPLTFIMSSMVNKYLIITFVYATCFNCFIRANALNLTFPASSNQTESNISSTSDSSVIETSTTIYTTFLSTHCVNTEYFSRELDGAWTEYDIVNDRQAYSMEYGLNGHTMMYMYWNNYRWRWNIAPDTSTYWYWCTEYDLANCTTGAWRDYYGDRHNDWIDSDATVIMDGECPTSAPTTSSPTTSPTFEDCTPYIVTLNFYDSEMDGIWLWSDENEEYRLNISGSTGYYKIKYINSWWFVYEVYSVGEVSDYLGFCGEPDIQNCGGEWQFWDEIVAYWAYDPEATVQLVDCTYSECNVIGLAETDTNCMLSVIELRGMNFNVFCSIT